LTTLAQRLVREHGLLGRDELILCACSGGPDSTALLHAKLTGLVLLFTLMAVALFVAHEPALIRLGGRGRRVKRRHGRRAGAWLAGLAVVTVALVVATALSLPQAPRPRQLAWAAAVPATLFLAMVPIVLRQQQKSLAGELLAMATLAAASMPLAVAGAVELGSAILLAVVWWLTFATGALAVRGVTRRKEPGQERLMWRLALGAGVLAPLLAAAAAASGSLPWWPCWGLLPTTTLVLAAALVGVAPSQLRLMGWVLAGSSLVTLVLLSPAVTRLG